MIEQMEVVNWVKREPSRIIFLFHAKPVKGANSKHAPKLS
jgi:hypothetical protein